MKKFRLNLSITVPVNGHNGEEVFSQVFNGVGEGGLVLIKAKALEVFNEKTEDIPSCWMNTLIEVSEDDEEYRYYDSDEVFCYKGCFIR